MVIRFLVYTYSTHNKAYSRSMKQIELWNISQDIQSALDNVMSGRKKQSSIHTAHFVKYTYSITVFKLQSPR